MDATTTPYDRYSTGAIWFHWIIAALIIFNIIVGILHDPIPALRALMGAHKAVGITVLLLSVGRIGWRLAHRPPPLPAYLAAWERKTAVTVRSLFYVLMLVMPLSGWLMSSASAHPRPIYWFGLFRIPLLPVPHAVEPPASTTHAVLGYLFAVLVVLHILGALRHHFVLRDTVLTRVVPGLTPRG